MDEFIEARMLMMRSCSRGSPRGRKQGTRARGRPCVPLPPHSRRRAWWPPAGCMPRGDSASFRALPASASEEGDLPSVTIAPLLPRYRNLAVCYH